MDVGSEPACVQNRATESDTAGSTNRNCVGALLWITATILLALYFAQLGDSLYKNETFNNLAMGLDVSPQHPALLALRDAAVANCNQNDLEDLKLCRVFQNIIPQNLYFAQPIQAFFGSLLADGYGKTPWLLEVSRVAVWSQITTAFLAVALWLLFVAALPRRYGAIVSLATMALVLMAYFLRGDLTFVLPDPIAFGVQPWEGLAIVALIAVIFLGVPAAGRLLTWPPARRLGGLLEGDWRCWSMLGTMILAQMVLPMALKPIVQGAALALLFLFLVRDAKTSGPAPRDLLIIVFLLLVLVSGDSSTLLRKLDVPRSSAFLVFGAAMAYLTVWPRRRLILLLPIIVIFHASVSALLGLGLVCAELPIVIVRRRISPAFVAGLLTFGCGLLITLGFETDLLGISWDAVRHLGRLVSQQPWRLLSMIVVLSSIAALTLWPLLARDPKYDDLARIGLLTLQILLLAFIRNLFLEVDPSLRETSGYYILVSTASHVNAGLVFGACLSLFVLFGRYIAKFDAMNGSEPESERNLGLYLRKATVLLLLIGIANLNFKPRPFLIDTVYNLVAYALLQRIQSPWCSHLQDASRNDDHYILSSEKPTNGPENYFSVLKLKTRIVTGAFDPENMTIGMAPNLTAKDDDDRSGAYTFTKVRKAIQDHFDAYDCVSRT